jgi:hypothetical protein
VSLCRSTVSSRIFAFRDRQHLCPREHSRHRMLCTFLGLWFAFCRRNAPKPRGVSELNSGVNMDRFFKGRFLCGESICQNECETLEADSYRHGSNIVVFHRSRCDEGHTYLVGGSYHDLDLASRPLKTWKQCQIWSPISLSRLSLVVSGLAS